MDDKTFSLLDTILKIGLGAMIAGIVTILTPFILFTKEVLSDRRARRLKLLEDAIECFYKYHEHQLRSLKDRANYKRCLIEGAGIKEAEKRLSKAVETQSEYDSEFNRATARLELLGLHSSAAALRDYDSFLECKMIEIMNTDDKLLLDSLYQNLGQEVRSRRRKVYEVLGTAYDLEPELRRMHTFDGKVL